MSDFSQAQSTLTRLRRLRACQAEIEAIKCEAFDMLRFMTGNETANQLVEISNHNRSVIDAAQAAIASLIQG